jgi:hypothetical protein
MTCESCDGTGAIRMNNRPVLTGWTEVQRCDCGLLGSDMEAGFRVSPEARLLVVNLVDQAGTTDVVVVPNRGIRRSHP